MNFQDLISLLISIAAFIYLVIHGVFKSSNEEAEEIVIVPPPIVPPMKKKRVQAVQKKEGQALISPRFEESISYDVIGKAKSSKGHQLLSRLQSKKEMVILKEIIGPPKGLL